MTVMPHVWDTALLLVKGHVPNIVQALVIPHAKAQLRAAVVVVDVEAVAPVHVAVLVKVQVAAVAVMDAEAVVKGHAIVHVQAHVMTIAWADVNMTVTLHAKDIV